MLNRLKERGINGWLVGLWEEVGLPGEGRGVEGTAFAVTKCEALHALIPVHKSHRQIKPST